VDAGFGIVWSNGQWHAEAPRFTYPLVMLWFTQKGILALICIKMRMFLAYWMIWNFKSAHSDRLQIPTIVQLMRTSTVQVHQKANLTPTFPWTQPTNFSFKWASMCNEAWEQKPKWKNSVQTTLWWLMIHYTQQTLTTRSHESMRRSPRRFFLLYT